MTDPRPGARRRASIDAFLTGYIRINPGQRFGQLMKAAQAACGVSRRTAAGHLGRLVRFGEVVVRSDRTYVLANPASPASLPIIELRWYDQLNVIQPDGTTQYFIEREFRVLSGRLDRMEIYLDPPARHFASWCSVPSRSVEVSADQASTGRPAYFVEFARPLESRDPDWKRVCFVAEVPREHPMALPPGRRGRPARTHAKAEHDSVWMQVPSQDVRFGRRLTGDAVLRFQLAFPEGYPIGAVRYRVRLLSQLDRYDSEEEARLARISQEEWEAGGLRRSGSIISLVVPQPLVDRRYEIEWKLPSTGEVQRWARSHARGRGRALRPSEGRTNGSGGSLHSASSGVVKLGPSVP